MTVDARDLSYLTHEQMFWKNASLEFSYVCFIVDLITKISSISVTPWNSQNRTFRHGYYTSSTCGQYYMLKKETMVLVQKRHSYDWKLEALGAWIVLGVVVFFHLLSLLMCLWSLRFRISMQYRKVDSFCLEIKELGDLCGSS